MTCVDADCADGMTKSPDERYFGYSFPQAHACIQSDGTQGAAWSCPGEVGSSTVDEDGNPSAMHSREQASTNGWKTKTGVTT